MNFIYLLIRDFIYFIDLKNKMYIFVLFFQPITILTVVYFISISRDPINVERYIIAVSIISMWTYVLYSSGSSLVIQKWTDTLNLLIAAPVSLFNILVTKVVNNSVVSLISFFITLLYAKVIFGFDITIGNVTYFIISMVSLLFSLSVIGMILAIIFATYKNVFQMQNLILYPILILSGIFYPVSNFQISIQVISYLIPMTWSIENIYIALEGATVHTNSLIISFVITITYFIVTYFIVQKMEQTLKKNGKIGAF